MASYASGLSDTGPSCNNVSHLTGSVPNVLLTLHMRFINGLVLRVLVWFMASLHSVNKLASEFFRFQTEASTIVVELTHAFIDAAPGRYDHENNEKRPPSITNLSVYRDVLKLLVSIATIIAWIVTIKKCQF